MGTGVGGPLADAAPRPNLCPRPQITTYALDGEYYCATLHYNIDCLWIILKGYAIY